MACQPYPVRVEDLVVQVYNHLFEFHCEQLLFVLLKHNQAKAEQGLDAGR